MAELDLDRWTEQYRRVCALPRADPGGFSDALELAALAASEMRRARAERDRLRADRNELYLLADQYVPLDARQDTVLDPNRELKDGADRG